MILVLIPDYLLAKGLEVVLKDLLPNTDIQLKKCDEKGDIEQELSTCSDLNLVVADASLYPSVEPFLLENKHIKLIVMAKQKPVLSSSANVDVLLYGACKQEVLHVFKKNIALLGNTVATQSKTSVLSDREEIVLREVALGKTNKEIADKLCISAHTVITHRKNITRKLGIKTVSGLTVYAILNGLIDTTRIS